MNSFRLPATGDVTIGRGHECHVSIDDPRIAPHHLTLRIGQAMTVFDTGAGPTTVGQRRLDPGEACPVSPGIIIVLGAVTVVIQSAAPSTRLQHVRSHDYFEGRLEDECARAQSTHETFTVVRLSCEPGQSAVLEEGLADILRPEDVVASYAPEQYELLLLDSNGAQAEAQCQRLSEQAGESGAKLRFGSATFPDDARTPEALLAAAGASLEGGKRRDPSLVSGGFMQEIWPLLERVAATAMSVFILGETGTGKEVVARQVHALSSRSKKPMVSINCASVHEGLLESELFGHERGAFTGVAQTKPGLLEVADGGTVFLDEIGDMPLALQAKLLRVVEQKQVRRVGGLASKPIDVRFLAATTATSSSRLREEPSAKISISD